VLIGKSFHGLDISVYSSPAWEMGRTLAYYKKEGLVNVMRAYFDGCRRYWTDWMRGQEEPQGWEDRFDISRENWHESFLLYERDLRIQEDLEWFVEAVFVFYTKHLDKLIRENDKLWGDFGDARGNILEGLELNTFGIYDMTIPGIQVPMSKKMVIPKPERHFSFSTKVMVMAVALYEEETQKDLCPYTACALKKLRQFVDRRKEMTAQSYRFFDEHAYNQFFQHEAFQQSATARTKAKDIGAGEFQTSTRLAGYVWIAGEKKMTHVPKDQADDVDMEDRDEDDEELDDLPRLQVIVKPQEKKDDDKGVSSLQREETQEQDGPSGDDDDVLEDVAPTTSLRIGMVNI
jgi:hypothetical protein